MGVGLQEGEGGVQDGLVVDVETGEDAEDGGVDRGVEGADAAEDRESEIEVMDVLGSGGGEQVVDAGESVDELALKSAVSLEEVKVGGQEGVAVGIHQVCLLLYWRGGRFLSIYYNLS